MARLFSIRPTLTLRGRRFLGVRGWTGKPTHPPLTDFPIVCYVLAAGCDVVSFAAGSAAVQHDFFMAGCIVIVAGAVVSLGTATTGVWDWWKGLARDRRTGPIGRAQHTQVWRSAAVMVLSVVAGLLVAFGAAFGGALVFEYQFNVESIGKGSTVWDETEVDQLPGRKARPAAGGDATISGGAEASSS
jgi:uncharacterized membrane protein